MLNADEYFWCVGYAIQSLEQRVCMLHCNHAEEIQTETITFYGISVIKLITLTVWECNIIIAQEQKMQVPVKFKLLGNK